MDNIQFPAWERVSHGIMNKNLISTKEFKDGTAHWYKQHPQNPILKSIFSNGAYEAHVDSMEEEVAAPTNSASRNRRMPKHRHSTSSSVHVEVNVD